ncbi:hypothetical protein SSE37_01845 [Sagittula stellata E-37]|uniref:Uncharacterized protein n=1 Tax=Sagittula stellata (strain ATCC 700073 / DSM 11524 / E-37) TaxID=388399 RepID=A3K4Q7_SAGS3|nr:hypothetical protein SSE37_01845 [Sagittula stellata E-37]
MADNRLILRVAGNASTMCDENLAYRSAGPAARSGSIGPRSARYPAPEDEERLTDNIIELADQYGRNGYRMVTGLLNNAGWQVIPLPGRRFALQICREGNGRALEW